MLVAAATVGAMFVRVEPTGFALTDHVFAGLFVGTVSLAATRARRWTWLTCAGVVAVFATTPWASALGVGAILGGIAGSWRRRPLPELGAIVGGLSGTAALRLADGGHARVSALLAAAAVAPVLVSGYRRSRRTARSRIRTTVAVLLAGTAAIFLLWVVVLAQARTGADRGVRETRLALDALHQGDLDAAAAHLHTANDSFELAGDDLDAWWSQSARVLPGVGPNAEALRAVVGAADDLTFEAADVVDRALGEQLGDRAGRFDPTAFGRLAPSLGELVAALDQVGRRLHDVDSPWIAGPVAERLQAVDGQVGTVSSDVRLALTGTQVLPDLLGSAGERRYLVLFVTPVEARASGFAGNYAELVLQDGALSMPVFGRLNDLRMPPASELHLDMPSEFLQRYDSFDIRNTWHSVTTSPDFPSVARLARQLYVASGGPEVDGVITVDPDAIAALLRLTGPIPIDGVARPLSAQNAAEFLLSRQYEVFDEGPDRIDALESLGRATFTRLTTADLPAPIELARVLGPAAAAGHLRFETFEPATQQFLAEIGVDDALPRPAPDGIGVVNTNVTGNKTDLYLHRDVDYRATWDPATGAIRATLTVTLTNDAPTSGLPEYVLGDGLDDENVPFGTNRTRLSVYTPLQLDRARVDGMDAPVESSTELGYAVYGTTIELHPAGGQATFELQLSGVLSPNDYALAVWPQVLANADHVHVEVDVVGTSAYESSGFGDDHGSTTADAALTETRRYEIHTTSTHNP